MTRIPFYVLTIAVVLGACGCNMILTEKDKAVLQLAKDSKSDYQIVKPEKMTEVDEYAINVLCRYIKDKTDAQVTIVEPGKMEQGKPSIFIGLSQPAQKALGADATGGLKPQEHVARSIGRDIYLYGEGIHGNFSAIMLFMEQELSRRWFDPNQPPLCVKQKDLTLKKFNHQRRFSFPYRTMPWDQDWSYQNGKNVDYSFDKRHRPGFVPDLYMDLPMYAAQTSFTYLPPTTEHRSVLRRFPWMTNENYFKTNPEYYSSNKDGRRVAKQLCFSNPQLRQEFTKNLLRHLDEIMADQAVPEELRKRTVLSIGDTDDNSLKRLCHCPGCLALAKDYQSNGGPMFDYVIEFAGILKKKQPQARVKFTAYRIWHTVVPPVLPSGKEFPDNVIVHFAAVEDLHNYPWADPRNRDGIFADYLQKWSRLVKSVWVWYYPSNYGLPHVQIKRIAADMKLMKEVGVECIYNEDYNPERYISAGFAPLSSYVFLRLAQDVNTDLAALIREYTDHTYGAGAELARRYLAELEDGQINAVFPTGLGAAQFNFNGEFSYLSPANIYRWQQWFDKMSALTANDESCNRNVQLLRRPLELATLLRFRELREAYPDYFNDYQALKKRVPKLLRFGGDEIIFMSDMRLNLADMSRGLPPELKGIDPVRLHREFVYGAKRVNDPAAAFGCAAAVGPELPFTFGIYQLLDDQWDVRSGKLYNCSLSKEAIKPGKYCLYKLGEIELVRGTHLWFTGAWRPELRFGGDLYRPGQDNLYDLYASLKFDGPLYGGNATEDTVLCDQIILVKK